MGNNKILGCGTDPSLMGPVLAAVKAAGYDGMYYIQHYIYINTFIYN
jgi:hypothetical protein